MSDPNDIIGFSFPGGQPVYRAREMTDEERACDCGCEDIEREPISDLTYYVEPDLPEFLTSPGVTSAWFLLDGEYVPVAIMSAGDGTANVMRTDL